MSNVTRLQKSTNILKDAKATQWCYVNIDNEFIFMNNVFIIDKSVEEYKVINKAGEVDEYTNESYMEEILAVLNKDNKIVFYNQSYDLVEKVTIKE